MSNKVQLIKEEIEKRKQEIWPKNTGEMRVVDTPKPLVQGWLNALDWVLNILDSLPETNEDLEEEIISWLRNGNITDIRYDNYADSDIEATARHFAHWQHGKDFDDLLQSEMEFPKEFYQKGYDQAMQYFLKYLKYCSTFTDMNGNIIIDDDLFNALTEDFKNYIENEM